MVPGQHAVDRKISVKVRQNLLSTGSVAPIPHQVAHNGEEGNKLNARLLHAGICCVANKFSVGARTFDVSKDGVAFSTESESQECGADVGCDTRDDDLLLARGLDSVSELGIVPGAGCDVSIGCK